MNYHNPTDSYLRPAVNIGVRPQLRRRPQLDVSLDIALLKATGKIALMVIPVIVLAHLFFSSVVTDTGESIGLLADKHSSLTDKNIELRALKARMTAPENVQLLAAEKLSLTVPGKGQVRTYNKRYGNFTYL